MEGGEKWAPGAASNRNAMWKPLILGFWGKIVVNFWKGSRDVVRGLDHVNLPIPCSLLLPSQRFCGMTSESRSDTSKQSLAFFGADIGNWWMLVNNLYYAKWKMLTADYFRVHFVIFADFLSSMCFVPFSPCHHTSLIESSWSTSSHLSCNFTYSFKFQSR